VKKDLSKQLVDHSVAADAKGHAAVLYQTVRGRFALYWDKRAGDGHKRRKHNRKKERGKKNKERRTYMIKVEQLWA
jgi:hypothetical protein